jgi:hypothetical protein
VLLAAQISFLLVGRLEQLTTIGFLVEYLVAADRAGGHNRLLPARRHPVARGTRIPETETTTHEPARAQARA